MRRDTAFIPGLRRGLLICSLVLALPFSLSAQETAQQPEPPTKGAEQAETPDKASPHHGKEHMHEKHEQMATMHKEMNEELQRQMTTLRAHTQTMSGITDTQQLVAEIKKHQQLSDDLLNTLIEQRQRMHSMMHEHHKHERQRSEHQAKPGCCAMEHKEPPVSQQ
jgi:Flp pilus assembly protein TadD